MTHANAAMPDAATARSSGGWEEFRAPGPWNAPAAYWFWHRIPTRSEIVAQIQAMRDAGYQSFQIQTRLSFPRDRYLSDDYLAMCRLAADEAASRGMMIGIYDEYNSTTTIAGPVCRATVWRGAGCSRRRCFARCAGGMISTVCWPETRGARWRLAKADMPRYALSVGRRS